MSIEQRGKDLRWNPSFLRRELGSQLSQLRGVLEKLSNLDEEFGEAQVDEAKLLAKRADTGLLRVMELLEQVGTRQVTERKKDQ